MDASALIKVFVRLQTDEHLKFDLWHSDPLQLWMGQAHMQEMSGGCYHGQLYDGATKIGTTTFHGTEIDMKDPQGRAKQGHQPLGQHQDGSGTLMTTSLLLLRRTAAWTWATEAVARGLESTKLKASSMGTYTRPSLVMICK